MSEKNKNEEEMGMSNQQNWVQNAIEFFTSNGGNSYKDMSKKNAQEINQKLQAILKDRLDNDVELIYKVANGVFKDKRKYLMGYGIEHIIKILEVIIP